MKVARLSSLSSCKHIFLDCTQQQLRKLKVISWRQSILMKKQTNCKRSKIVVASKERKGRVLYKSVQKSLQFGNSVSKLRHTSESSIPHNTLFLNSWTFNIRTRISICPWIQVKNTNKWSQYWYNTRRQELRDKTIQNKYTDVLEEQGLARNKASVTKVSLLAFLQ